MTKTALVVDDSAVIRQALGYTLRELGFAVTEGANGQEGVDRLDSDTFKVIFTDVNMPVMDGITFITHVRAHPKQRFVPVLVVTTEGCQDMITKGKAAGATGWLIKPVSHEKVVAVLSKVVK